MNVRITGSLVTLVLSLGITARADGQSLSTGPSLAPRQPITLPVLKPPSANALFAAGQIVDRPTEDLRSRFHWGVFGSVVPNWSIPGSMGNLFFEQAKSPKMSGRDLRVGVVRGRQLGFEMGGSFVRKTITSLDVTQRDSTNSGFVPTTHFTSSNPIQLYGVDAHLMIPFLRIGERTQLGVLAGGGLAWLPDTPIQVRIDGPPFYASASTIPLNNPPATGGFVQWFSASGSGGAIPLVPGTRYALTEGTLEDVSQTDTFWMLLRGQLAADFLVAPPLKLRFTTGFNYPGLQAVGIDGVYLFRTGRVNPDRGRGAPGSVTPPGQIVDQPDVLALRRSYWGVIGGVTPKWWTPDSWGGFFQPTVPKEISGREIRIGLTRGRPLGYEFGVSFVQKSITRFTLERFGAEVFEGIPPDPVPVARITLTEIQSVRIPGAEFHAFVPIARIGSRVQLGALLGVGAARIPDTPIQKRIVGPPFFATATSSTPLTTLPAAGGFLVDEHIGRIPVGPGQTEAVVTVSATEISPNHTSVLILARGQIAADVLVARPLKIRFSGGFNYPGAQLFGVEAIYLFGTGRN